MKHNNKQNIERLKNIINIDKKKIEEEAKTNEKNINMLEECKKFCTTHTNESFNAYTKEQLQLIIDQGTGLLNNYFITDEHFENDQYIILQLQYIIVKATLINLEDTNKQNIDINNKLKETVNRANKLEDNFKTTYHQLQKIKQDQKSIIATIISIILAISIIPTAITGIQHIESTYILPFLASILLFGFVMISFIFSLYTEDFRKRIILYLSLMIIICAGSWYLALNYNIKLEPTDNKINVEIDNSNIQNNQLKK